MTPSYSYLLHYKPLSHTILKVRLLYEKNQFLGIWIFAPKLKTFFKYFIKYTNAIEFSCQKFGFWPTKKWENFEILFNFLDKKGKFGIVDFFVLFLNEFRKIRQRWQTMTHTVQADSPTHFFWKGVNVIKLSAYFIRFLRVLRTYLEITYIVFKVVTKFGILT